RDFLLLLPQKPSLNLTSNIIGDRRLEARRLQRLGKNPLAERYDAVRSVGTGDQDRGELAYSADPAASVALSVAFDNYLLDNFRELTLGHRLARANLVSHFARGLVCFMKRQTSLDKTVGDHPPKKRKLLSAVYHIQIFSSHLAPLSLLLRHRPNFTNNGGLNQIKISRKRVAGSDSDHFARMKSGLIWDSWSKEFARKRPGQIRAGLSVGIWRDN